MELVVQNSLSPIVGSRDSLHWSVQQKSSYDTTQVCKASCLLHEFCTGITPVPFCGF